MLDTISMTERRYKIYDLLSYAFINEPTDDLILALKELANLFEHLSGDDIDDLSSKNLEGYTQEFYDRLFVNSSPLYIPPFEAAIKNRTIGKNGKIKYGKLDSEETFHVKSCYLMVDYDPNSLNMFEPLRNSHFQDNIGFELGFMAFLVNNELISLKNKDEKNEKNWRNLQKDFLDRHLSAWICDYAKLTEEKGKGLYSVLSNMASEWVNLDKEYLFDNK